MPSLIIQTPRRTWESALSESVLVGRHPTCTIVIEQPEVPAHWLELRWTGSMWAWRPPKCRVQKNHTLADYWDSHQPGY